ncbi:PaaI family thioesterase [Alcaligenaceae bacterium]|nr:PaaI family thioesterase [Alcaligenaceae bacterium]
MNEEVAKQAFEHALETYEQDFGRFFLAKLYGLAFTYEKDTCLVEMEIKDFMFNPQGSVHGGVLAFVLDVSMGHLLKHEIGAGVTLEMNMQFARAAREGTLYARGSFTKRGREVCFLRSDAFVDDKLIATASSTWKVL